MAQAEGGFLKLKPHIFTLTTPQVITYEEQTYFLFVHFEIFIINQNPLSLIYLFFL